jgi:hypothetical protein
METVTWKIAKQHQHDASGVQNPEKWLWSKKNGVYYPLCKKL